MSKTFEPAPDEVLEMVEKVRREHYEPLDEAKVTINVMFVTNDTGTPITHQGCRAYATIRIVGQRDRAAGHKDAEMLIDAVEFLKMPAEEQESLIDHELHHLIVAKDGEGAVLYDPQDRPRLRMKKHDAQFGWFHEVAARRKAASMEVKQAKQLVEDYRQSFFVFLTDANTLNLK